ncbi:uncharacterized protein VDAG_05228 [Verticillium dahliae VdLs.17]|uniref:Uncharacterized protein n=1 Tax=Verticillium dahliae (strain VdLs.17 / ATCC MYA-4575 / FGSC 10137) TaxID=498257 RepID=G2X4Z6_VERDV|nr:uncharacterized protein VDAG_05228 [Verticillium dahliae VdLs.17]EGY23790.1 hypothetical protein VDAG_05228 [Verticillium dahliae VdLs.17]
MPGWLQTVLEGPFADESSKNGPAVEETAHNLAEDFPVSDRRNSRNDDCTTAASLDRRQVTGTPSLSLGMGSDCQKLRYMASEAYRLCPANKILRQIFLMWPLLDEAIQLVKEGITAPATYLEITKFLLDRGLCLDSRIKIPFIIEPCDWFPLRDHQMAIVVIMHPSPTNPTIECRYPFTASSQSSADQAGDFHFVRPGGAFRMDPATTKVLVLVHRVGQAAEVQ